MQCLPKGWIKTLDTVESHIIKGKENLMNNIHTIFFTFAIVAITVLFGCTNMTKQTTDDGTEESGTELALDETYDKIRNGARLIISYDEQNNTFKGTVENTTDETLKQVRVEVHLSNGKELGPTTPVDLAPGEKIDVELTATSKDFDAWTAHPEVGESEHGEGGEHGENDSEHGGEHDRESDGNGEHD